MIHLPEYPEISVNCAHLEAAVRGGLKEMPVFSETNMVMVKPVDVLRCFEVPGEPRDAGDRGAWEVQPEPPHRHKRTEGGAK